MNGPIRAALWMCRMREDFRIKNDDNPEALALASASGVSLGEEERFGCQSASDLVEAWRPEERRESSVFKSASGR